MGTTNSSTKLLRPTMLLLLLVATQCHGFSWFNLNLLSTPCNQCSMDTIKLTQGDYAKDKSSTPTSAGLQSDDNGCNKLTVTCARTGRTGEQTFMTLNDKKNLAGSLRTLPLICNAKGEWEFQFPGRDTTYAVTEVSCTHDSMNLPPFLI